MAKVTQAICSLALLLGVAALPTKTGSPSNGAALSEKSMSVSSHGLMRRQAAKAGGNGDAACTQEYVIENDDNGSWCEQTCVDGSNRMAKEGGMTPGTCTDAAYSHFFRIMDNVEVYAKQDDNSFPAQDAGIASSDPCASSGDGVGFDAFHDISENQEVCETLCVPTSDTVAETLARRMGAHEKACHEMGYTKHVMTVPEIAVYMNAPISTAGA